MSDEAPKEESTLEQIEKRRAERKRRTEAEALKQREIDLAAIDALEEEHGDTNITVLEVPFAPGLPTLVAARTPTEAEIKRYRHRLKRKKADAPPPDTQAAAEELAASCRVYPPDGEVYAELLSKRPGVHLQLGVAAANLALASAESEGKG